MRKRYFFFGLGIRILMLLVFLHINKTTQYNDASLIIFKGFDHLFSGENPYSFIYELEWGVGTFSQPLNYGPLIFLIYLPAMALPFWYGDLWIGMALMINIYSFFTADFLIQASYQDINQSNLFEYHLRNETSVKQISPKHSPRQSVLYYGGIIYWVIPFWTTTITVFIYAQIFLCTFAFFYRRKPFLVGLLLMIAGLSYQLVLLFLPIYAVYYLKQKFSKFLRFVLGCLPPFLILLFFIGWQYPAGTIESLFLYSGTMPYVKCPSCGNDLDNWSVFSIPRLLYLWSDGTIQIGNILRLVMLGILGSICVFFLFSPIFKKSPDKWIIRYQILAVALFILTTNYGQIHYIFFIAPPVIYLLQ
ncbi:MAG: hypothetical protein ACTSYU_04735, partial [Promethearchaeota archaeon]